MKDLRRYIRRILITKKVEEITENYFLNKITNNVNLLTEELNQNDRSDIKKMIRKDLESSTFRKEVDKAFKKNFDSALKKTLGVSYFGVPGKINKFVVDEIHDEVGKILAADVTRQMIGDICKTVIIKLYKDLSFSYPTVIKRIKV